MNVVGRVWRVGSLRNIFLSTGEKLYVLKHPRRFERFSASGFEEVELADKLNKMCAVEGRIEHGLLIVLDWEVVQSSRASE